MTQAANTIVGAHSTVRLSYTPEIGYGFAIGYWHRERSSEQPERALEGDACL
jgi:hypothetical protein